MRDSGFVGEEFFAAEVENLHFTGSVSAVCLRRNFGGRQRLLEPDVGGLDVAVQEALGVGGGEGAGDLAANPQNFVDAGPPAVFQAIVK